MHIPNIDIPNIDIYPVLLCCLFCTYASVVHLYVYHISTCTAVRSFLQCDVIPSGDVWCSGLVIVNCRSDFSELYRLIICAHYIDLQMVPYGLKSQNESHPPYREGSL